MLTENEMKLIYETVLILSNCTDYRVSLDGKIIGDNHEAEDAAAEVVAFMSQNVFRQALAIDEDAA